MVYEITPTELDSLSSPIYPKQPFGFSHCSFGLTDTVHIHQLHPHLCWWDRISAQRCPLPPPADPANVVPPLSSRKFPLAHFKTTWSTYTMTTKILYILQKKRGAIKSLRIASGELGLIMSLGNWKPWVLARLIHVSTFINELSEMVDANFAIKKGKNCGCQSTSLTSFGQLPGHRRRYSRQDPLLQSSCTFTVLRWARLRLCWWSFDAWFPRQFSFRPPS